MSGNDKGDIVVRRHDVVRMDASYREHIPTGPNPLVMQTDYGPIRVFISQRGSVVAHPSKDVLVHEGYHWSAAMEFTYYGDSYVGPLLVTKYPANPTVSQPVSRDNIVRQLRKAASTFMLKQEGDILKIALTDIATRLADTRALLVRAKADLAALPAESELPIARRYDQWFGTFWVSPGEGELTVRGGGFSGSITVGGKICRIEATLPLERGREPWISLVSILASEKQEAVPPILKASLLEITEHVRRDDPDLIQASIVIKSRRGLQVKVAMLEKTILKLERFAMMYRDRLDPEMGNQARPRPSSAA